MTRHLIVANQTLGGARLEQEITDRIRGRSASFHVLVPMIDAAKESTTWSPGDAMARVPGQEGADALATAHRRSRHRLDGMIGRITALGGTATGEIGDPDPVRAVRDVLGRQAFDVVIVSTLPAGISRWLKLDLPSRIDRLCDAPVVVVEADPPSRSPA